MGRKYVNKHKNLCAHRRNRKLAQRRRFQKKENIEKVIRPAADEITDSMDDNIIVKKEIEDVDIIEHFNDGRHIHERQDCIENIEYIDRSEADVREKPKSCKKRSANYKQEEIKLLVKLCLEFSLILENKQTDSAMWKKKEETWKIIHTEFNAVTELIPRPVDSLKQKYETIKKDLKRKVRHNKQEAMKTDGRSPNYIHIEEYEKSLLEKISLQFYGLNGWNDFDADPHKTDLSSTAYQNEHLEEVSDKDIEGDSQQFSNDEHETIKMCNDENDISEPSTSSDKVESKWSSWNSECLKRRKSTTPSTEPKRFKRAEVHEQVDQLIYKRQDLVQLQRELIITEASYKCEEHKEQMKKIHEEINNLRKMDSRAEMEHQKRMELLDLDISIKKKQLVS